MYSEVSLCITLTNTYLHTCLLFSRKKLLPTLKTRSSAKQSLNRDLSLNLVLLNRDCTVLVLFFQEKKYSLPSNFLCNTLKIPPIHFFTTVKGQAFSSLPVYSNLPIPFGPIIATENLPIEPVCSMYYSFLLNCELIK